MNFPSFTQWTTDRMVQASPQEKVSDTAIKSLLSGRSFKGIDVENSDSFGINQAISQYDSNDLKELEDYCKKRGIVGVNFTRMSPKAILYMLKSKTGEVTEKQSSSQTKRTLLNG